MPEYVDLRVHDRVALDEIELYAEVLGAVAASDGPLSNEELDEVLGVRPAQQGSRPDRLTRRVPQPVPYMTSTDVRVKPSLSYMRTAARLVSSTYSMTSARCRSSRR